VEIDSEHRVSLGGNLGGLELKETRLFGSTSIEDVGNLCGWSNFENKSCVSLCLLLFNFHCVLRVLEL
jgi:hypothetical protein